LRALSCDLAVHHPHALLLELLADCAQPQCTETAWRLANDAWRLTWAPLLFPPHVVAVACVRMAFVLHSLNSDQWLQRMAVREADVHCVTRMLTDAYQFAERVAPPPTSAAAAALAASSLSKSYQHSSSSFSASLSAPAGSALTRDALAALRDAARNRAPPADAHGLVKSEVSISAPASNPVDQDDAARVWTTCCAPSAV
jgi:hypothetical protein